MKVQQILLVIMATSIAASINANPLENIMKNWKNSDSVFSPKLFKFMLMLPTTNTEETKKVDNNIHDDIHQISITDKEVHPIDLVTSSLEDFFNKGGKSKFATIFSKHDEMRKTFRRMILDIEPKHEKTLSLVHGGKKIAPVKPQNLKQCLLKNKDLGAQLINEEDKFIFVFQDNKFVFTREEFNLYRPFLHDVCFMVEYIRMHYNDYNKNMVIHHLESVKAILSSEHSKEFMQFLYNSINVVRKSVVEKFGQDGVSFLVSTFAQSVAGSMPFFNHERVLEADTGAPVVGAIPETDFGWSLRVVFGVVFCFLILYTSVYMYQIEIYKDSLVFAKFISSKKDKKAN